MAPPFLVWLWLESGLVDFDDPLSRNASKAFVFGSNPMGAINLLAIGTGGC